MAPALTPAGSLSVPRVTGKVSSSAPTHGSRGLPKAVDVRQAIRFGREHAELRAWSAGAQPVARVGSIWRLASLWLFPVLRCELQRSKEREPLWNCRFGDLSVLDTRPDFLHEISNKDHPTPSKFSRLAAAGNEQRDLIDVLGNRHTWKQPRNVLAARLKFLRVPSLPPSPAVRVKGWFDLTNECCSGWNPTTSSSHSKPPLGSLPTCTFRRMKYPRSSYHSATNDSR